jgi:hypothetical protein
VDLAEACLALNAGALWVACNVDPTLPTERGQLPGNGSMVAALRSATGREPLVAGKPQRRLLDQAAVRLGIRRPLVVGDRLDTDVAGATAAGMDALLVLTGVSTAADVLVARPPLRPRFVAAGMEALHEPAVRSEIAAQASLPVRLDGATVTLSTNGATAGGAGSTDPIAALRALCAACWPADVRPAQIRAADEPSREALAALRLT